MQRTFTTGNDKTPPGERDASRCEPPKGVIAMSDRAFGELLRQFRITAGLSQEELAERARLSPGAISALERVARRAPQRQTLALLADALHLDDGGRAALEFAAAAGRRRGARTPAARNGTATPNNLPNLVSSFHGREAELAAARRLMTTRRLVTLLGAGGVGKTRLALEAARAELHGTAFADGIWFIDFASLSSPSLVTSAVARALGIRERASEALADTLVASISAHRLLLVFDNCEHLIDECALLAERLARDCSAAVIVATTREALRIDGEAVLRVEPLAFEDRRPAGPALELLLDRLADADHARYAALDERDRAHAATICRRLDGIPLALELAAGRARDLSLAEIADGLDQRFALLANGRRTAAPRQQTLLGMIDWSFALLSNTERELFSRLGVFAGAFTAESARAVSPEGAGGVNEPLDALSAKSLLVAAVDHRGRRRYRLLESMRAFALDRLRESGDDDATEHRFAEYFAEVAALADARYGRMTNADFLALVEDDLDHFRAALEWTLGRGHDVVLGARLAGAMGWIYRQTALFGEGTRWCERALAATPQLDHRIAGRLHMALSFFSFNAGAMQRALDEAIAATACYRAAAAPSDLSWALTQQAYCLYLLQRAGDARSAADEAVAVARGQDDPLRLAGALNALTLTIPIERAAERFEPLEEAIRCYRAAGDDGAIVPTANLAETHYATGNFAAALAFGLEVVEMTRRNRDRSNLAAALTNVAAYALTVDDVERAEAAAREALQLVRNLGKTLNAMCALQHLGGVAARRGDAVRAARMHGASDRLYREFGLTREHTERSLYDAAIAILRTKLGTDGLRRHLAAGAGLPLDDAIAEGLAGG